MADSHISVFHSLSELPHTAKKRVVTTGGYYAFLKIAEGCDKRCTYCIIPSLRGPYRSVPMERLLEEARELADNGVRELILVAQETTLYGKDIYGEKSLPKLLHELAKIPGIYWIRIQYCYPEEITDELIEAIKSEEKVCHYLDIPIQHASDRILRRMGRRTHKEELKERIAKLRREIPDIALSHLFFYILLGSAVIVIYILGILDQLMLIPQLLKLFFRKEKVFSSVFFTFPWFSRSGRDRKRIIIIRPLP